VTQETATINRSAGYRRWRWRSKNISMSWHSDSPPCHDDSAAKHCTTTSSTALTSLEYSPLFLRRQRHYHQQSTHTSRSHTSSKDFFLPAPRSGCPRCMPARSENEEEPTSLPRKTHKTVSPQSKQSKARQHAANFATFIAHHQTKQWRQLVLVPPPSIMY